MPLQQLAEHLSQPPRDCFVYVVDSHSRLYLTHSGYIFMNSQEEKHKLFEII